MPGFAVSPEQRRAFDEDGYFVTAPAFSEAELAPVRSAIEEAWAARRTERPRAEEARWDRLRPELPRLHRVSDAAAEFCRSPVFAAIAAACIGPDADMMWNQAHVKAVDEAGLTRFPWHQDGAYAQMEHPETLSCWVALTRCDGRNGAMVMSPGSHTALLPHRWDEDLKYLACAAREPVHQLEMDVGQIVVFRATTAHASPPNRGDSPRFGYSLSFSLPEQRLLPSRMLFGDQVPVARGGRSTDDVMREYALGERGAARVRGEAIVDAIRRRLPRQGAAIDAALRVHRAAVGAGDAIGSRRALNALFAISEEDVNVNGDLVGARNDPDAIVREYATLGSDITREQRRLLLLRALELDPDHAAAKAELARLG
ncbi:MAG: phytanoyl-CoA dioxygenase family protein [Deltaproteobacteria bacterium]|nr:phytanoyl-CoA dioxygenase family protein [Deltaproteobacteria bacterium]